MRKRNRVRCEKARAKHYLWLAADCEPYLLPLPSWDHLLCKHPAFAQWDDRVLRCCQSLRDSWNHLLIAPEKRDGKRQSTSSFLGRATQCSLCVVWRKYVRAARKEGAFDIPASLSSNASFSDRILPYDNQYLRSHEVDTIASGLPMRKSNIGLVNQWVSEFSGHAKRSLKVPKLDGVKT